MQVTLEEDTAGGGGRKRRRLFVGPDVANDPLPLEYRHLRDSERNVKDNFYLTCDNLHGEGFSLQQCVTSVVLVGNGMFSRSWKRFEDENGTFSLNTAPEKINVLDKLRQIEAKSLGLVVEAILDGKQQGKMITHASDSTLFSPL